MSRPVKMLVILAISSILLGYIGLALTAPLVFIASLFDLYESAALFLGLTLPTLFIGISRGLVSKSLRRVIFGGVFGWFSGVLIIYLPGMFMIYAELSVRNINTLLCIGTPILLGLALGSSQILADKLPLKIKGYLLNGILGGLMSCLFLIVYCFLTNSFNNYDWHFSISIFFPIVGAVIWVFIEFFENKGDKNKYHK